jgi:hypothetical protein
LKIKNAKLLVKNDGDCSGTTFGCSECPYESVWTKVGDCKNKDVLAYVTKWLRDNDNTQRILCAAIWFDDGIVHVHQPKNIQTGFVICGRRHHNCFATLSAITDKRHFEFEKEQGFLTNDDMFMNRVDAAKVAFEAKQTDEIKKELFSEDLY